mgnify:CR=1 FL=1
MRKKKVTMSDIATEAGVSQPTVSAILNGSDSIKVSEATRIKVLNKARELGYALKQNIRHSNMHPRIALVVNSLNMHDPFINAVSAAKTRAWELDYLLVVFDYEEDEELKQAIFSEIKEDDYQGMIFASNTPKSISPLDDAPQIPTVMLNCFCDVPSTITAVVAADFLGGYRATDHLISRNYRYIAMITGESWSESSIQRQKGYQQALVNAAGRAPQAPVEPGVATRSGPLLPPSPALLLELLADAVLDDAAEVASPPEPEVPAAAAPLPPPVADMAARSVVASLVASAFLRYTTWMLPLAALLPGAGGWSSLSTRARTWATRAGLAARSTRALLRGSASRVVLAPVSL